MTQASEFWNRTAARYAATPPRDEAVVQRTREMTREHLTPHMEVLDFGCGTGTATISHAPFVAHIHGIDFSSEMIAIARQRAAEAGVANVSFETASIESFDESDPRFDAVLGLNVLHLLDDRDAVVGRVFELLRPGGVFVSTTVCLGWPGRLLAWLAPIARGLGLIPTLKAFTVRELRRSLTRAGFEIEREWETGVWKAVLLVARKPT